MATRAQIYREILREYDALRTRKAAELRERKESLYERFPRLAEIEEELSLLAFLRQGQRWAALRALKGQFRS